MNQMIEKAGKIFTGKAGLFRTGGAAMMLCAVLLSIAVLAGCKSGKAPEKKKEADTSLVTQGDKKTPVITLKEMDTLFKATFEGELQKLTDKQKADALDNLMKNGDFQKQFFERGQWDTTAAMAEMAKQKKLDESEEYKTMLDLFKMQILAKLYNDKIVTPELNKIKVGPKDVDEFYLKNKDMLFNGWRDVSIIVVKDKDEADKLFASLENNTAGFAAAAKSKSIDESTKGNGGYFGKVTKSHGQMGQQQPQSLLPEVEAAAFATSKGKVSKPVATRNGWYIVYVKDASETDYPALDEAMRARLQPGIEEQKKTELTKKMVDDVKKQLGIKINETLIPKIGETWLKEERAKLGKAPAAPAAPAMPGMPAGHPDVQNSAPKPQ